MSVARWGAALSLGLALAFAQSHSRSPYVEPSTSWVLGALLPPPIHHLTYCQEALEGLYSGRANVEALLARVERFHRVRFPSGVYFTTSMGLALEACLKVGLRSDLLLSSVPQLVVPVSLRDPTAIKGWKAFLEVLDAKGQVLASLSHLDFTPLVYPEGQSYRGHVVYTFWGGAVFGPRPPESFYEAAGRAHAIRLRLERGGKRESYPLSPERYPDLW